MSAAELAEKCRALLVAATPRPWGTGEHVGEPRAICSTPQGLESLLGLDRDGMAICASAADAALIVFAVDNLAALCDALRIEKQRADEAEAGAAAMREALTAMRRARNAAIEKGQHEGTALHLEFWTHMVKRDALATDPGAALLARLHTTELDRDALRDTLAVRDADAKGQIAALMATARDRDEARREVETLRAEVERLKARTAKVCEMCRTVPGEWTIAQHACPDCRGSGAVIVEAP